MVAVGIVGDRMGDLTCGAIGCFLSLDSQTIVMYYRDTKIETCPEEPNRISGACFIICTEDNECPTGQNGCGEVGDCSSGPLSKKRM